MAWPGATILKIESAKSISVPGPLQRVSLYAQPWSMAAGSATYGSMMGMASYLLALLLWPTFSTLLAGRHRHPISLIKHA
jgi:hypothetical protein